MICADSWCGVMKEDTKQPKPLTPTQLLGCGLVMK